MAIGVERGLGEATRQGLRPFKAAIKLGAVALNLERQRKKILEALESFRELDGFTAEEGVEIQVRTAGQEDVLTCERLTRKFGDWDRVYRHDAYYEDHMSGSWDNLHFVGKSIRSDWEDPSAPKFWVYNEANDFRVLWDEDVNLSVVEPPDLLI